MVIRFSLRSWLVGLLYLVGGLGLIGAISPNFRLETKVENLTMTETLALRFGGPWTPFWTYDRVKIGPTPITKDFVVPKHLAPFQGPARVTSTHGFSFIALLTSTLTFGLSGSCFWLAGHIKAIPALGGELHVDTRTWKPRDGKTGGKKLNHKDAEITEI